MGPAEGVRGVFNLIQFILKRILEAGCRWKDNGGGAGGEP